MVVTLALTLGWNPFGAPAGEVCRVQPGAGPHPGSIDPVATQDWANAVARQDGALMQRIAGTYAMESRAVVGGQTYDSRQTVTFDAVGSFGFTDQTCVIGPFPSCTPNQGHGGWVAVANGGGVFTLVRRFRDLSRVDACGGFQATLGPDGSLVDPRTGAVLARRVR